MISRCVIYDFPLRRRPIELPAWILVTLSEHPMSYRHIVRWVRLQRPRILPEAIEATVLTMLQKRVLEQDGEKLQIRGFKREVAA